MTLDWMFWTVIEEKCNTSSWWYWRSRSIGPRQPVLWVVGLAGGKSEVCIKLYFDVNMCTNEIVLGKHCGILIVSLSTRQLLILPYQLPDHTTQPTDRTRQPIFHSSASNLQTSLQFRSSLGFGFVGGILPRVLAECSPKCPCSAPVYRKPISRPFLALALV